MQPCAGADVRANQSACEAEEIGDVQAQLFGHFLLAELGGGDEGVHRVQCLGRRRSTRTRSARSRSASPPTLPWSEKPQAEAVVSDAL